LTLPWPADFAEVVGEWERLQRERGKLIALLALVVGSVTSVGQSPTPSSEVAAAAATNAPVASASPTTCLPKDVPSAEPAASSAPAADPSASTDPADPACVAGPDPAYADLYHDYVAEATPIVDAINGARSFAQHRRAWSRLEKVQAPYVDAIAAVDDDGGRDRRATTVRVTRAEADEPVDLSVETEASPAP
jgi:hypothetical protein